MAMFGVTGRESYDALYDALNRPADVSALEREQSAGFASWSDVLEPIKGLDRGLIKEPAMLAADAFTPVLTPIAKSIDDYFGSSTAEWLENERKKARDAAMALRPDGKTTTFVGGLLNGLFSIGGQFALGGALGGPAGAAAFAGTNVGYSSMQEQIDRGVDPMTALGVGAIEGGATAAFGLVAPSFPGGIAMRATTGAGLNLAFGAIERGGVSAWLNARGYSEMAKQYEVFDTTAASADAILGLVFGAAFGPRARGVRRPVAPPAPDAVPPSTVDAALTANQTKHAEIDVAPGIPTDTRSRQAHNDALNTAVESLVMGREVSVERILAEAGFTGKRPDFDALRVIADELEKAGATDIVAQVRALEAEARARGLMVDPDTIGSVLLSDKPVESAVRGLAGKEGEVRIGDDKVPVRYMLVEAQDVQATMMKADNQFRDRTRVASEQQISDIASRLDAALLMDAPVMDYGAPVLAADGTVIGGNGRAAAIGLAYERGTAQGYRDALRAEYGDAVDGMQRPMVVRVLQRDVDVQKAAILSNEGGALRMSALEQAKVDAERLGDFRAFEFSEDGDVNLVANMPFIREWVGQMPQNQRAAIMDADGRLSAEGAGRLRNAILYRAYGDSPTLARLVEATDPGSRNIAAALTRSAPAVADAREAIGRGELYPLGLHDDLISAVEKLDALRRTGMSVDDWMKQIDAFGDGMTAEARLLVQFMDRNIRGSRAISEGIFGFYNRLTEAGNPNQGSMFEAAQPDKMALLTRALDEPAPMYGRGGGLRSNVADLTAAFRAMFGRDADRLMETGRVRMVQSVRNLPNGPHPDDVGGMYWKGEAWVVADNTGMSQIRGRVLHEVGEHAGMEQMLGPELYRQVLDTVARKAETDPVFQQARALAESRANRPEHVPAETLAYLVENAPELPIVRRILAAVRQWLYRTTGGRFVDLNQADLQMMAVASLRRYAREAEIAEKGGDAPWYMTLFHGTPNPFKPEADAPLGKLQWRFINSGEGAQAFGYGHYLAQQEWIARTRYRDRLVERKGKSASMTIVNGQIVPNDLMTEYGQALASLGDRAKGSIDDLAAALRKQYGDKFDALIGGKTTVLSGDDGPAYRIGDRIVHYNMGGKEQNIAQIVDGVKNEGYAEQFKFWNRRKEEAEAYSKDADLARAQEMLRILNDVTVEADPSIEKRQFRGRDSYVVNGKGNGFPTLKEAKAYAASIGKQRVLRPDITEVRPESPKGALYGKFIPDDTWNQMMIWDAPYSAQPANVKAALDKVAVAMGLKGWDPDVSAEYIYTQYMAKQINELTYSDEFGDMIMPASYEANSRRAPEGMDPIEFDYDPRADELASIILNQLGVPGHRFLDGQTRSGVSWDSADAKFNVVLYSDDLGRVAWEAKEGDAEWVTANGRGRIYWKSDAVDAADGGRAAAYMIEVDGKEVGSAATVEEATRIGEQALEGQLYSRTGDGANMAAPDPLEDTTLPNARVLSAEADAEIATAQELSQGFLPAVECALRVGE